MNIIPRLIKHGNGGNGAGPVPEHAVQMIKWATGDWTPSRLREMIETDHIPQQYLEYTVKYLSEHPALMLNQKPQFMAACKIARPDLYVILDTPEGQRWLDKLGDELGPMIVRQGLRFLGLGV